MEQINQKWKAVEKEMNMTEAHLYEILLTA